VQRQKVVLKVCQQRFQARLPAGLLLADERGALRSNKVQEQTPDLPAPEQLRQRAVRVLLRDCFQNFNRAARLPVEALAGRSWVAHQRRKQLRVLVAELARGDHPNDQVDQRGFVESAVFTIGRRAVAEDPVLLAYDSDLGAQLLEVERADVAPVHADVKQLLDGLLEVPQDCLAADVAPHMIAIEFFGPFDHKQLSETRRF